MNQIKSNSRALVAFTVIVIMMMAIVGGTFAWISKSAGIDGNIATAGSIDISAKLAVDDTDLTNGTIANISDAGVLTVTNVLPGDVIKLTFTITNTGKNSAKVASIITASGTDAMIANFTVMSDSAEITLAKSAVSLGADVVLVPNATKVYAITLTFKSTVESVTDGDTLTFNLNSLATQVNATTV